MKKIKMTLVALAIVASTLGAYASKKFTNPCESQQQYKYESGLGYVPAPEWHYCLNGSANTCTYWLSNTAPLTYTACTLGLYGE